MLTKTKGLLMQQKLQQHRSGDLYPQPVMTNS